MANRSTIRELAEKLKAQADEAMAFAANDEGVDAEIQARLHHSIDELVNCVLENDVVVYNKSPRTRHVESMRVLAKYASAHPACHALTLAFADLECAEQLRTLIHPATRPKASPSHTAEQHVVCRNALLRDCGLEKS